MEPNVATPKSWNSICYFTVFVFLLYLRNMWSDALLFSPCSTMSSGPAITPSSASIVWSTSFTNVRSRYLLILERCQQWQTYLEHSKKYALQFIPGPFTAVMSSSMSDVVTQLQWYFKSGSKVLLKGSFKSVLHKFQFCFREGVSWVLQWLFQGVLRLSQYGFKGVPIGILCPKSVSRKFCLVI